MIAVPLLGAEKYPHCRIEPHWKDCFCGTKELRFDPLRDEENPLPPLTLRTAGGCTSLPVSFTITMDGQQKSAYLDQRSLVERLKVKPPLIEKYAKKDHLIGLVKKAFLAQHPELAVKKAVQKQKDLYFSPINYCIPHTVYAGQNGKLFFGLSRLLGKGSFATVTEGKTSEGQKIACRILRIQEKKEGDELQRILQFMERVCGKPGVIDLLGKCRYTSEDGVDTLVTFHPILQEDLLSIFAKRRHLNWQTKISYASQLFQGLLSLRPAAHGDLKPENVVVDGEILKLIDLDMYRTPEEQGEHDRGSIRWINPEVAKGDGVDVRNLDIWPLGWMLFGLFGDLYEIPWMCKGNATALKMIKACEQEAMNAMIRKSKFPQPLEELLLKMQVVDPKSRIFLEEAADLFEKQVAPLPDPATAMKT
ncbi:MAG TPA: protein kinase [Chlamydiales bacterium]|nr:protein kinase [Chlamydiales bacterium]